MSLICKIRNDLENFVIFVVALFETTDTYTSVIRCRKANNIKSPQNDNLYCDRNSGPPFRVNTSGENCPLCSAEDLA